MPIAQQMTDDSGSCPERFSLNTRTRTVAASVLLAIVLLASAGCDLLVSPEQRYERAQELVAKGEYRHALVELKNALQKRGDLHDARVLLAEVALWLGDPGSAEAELRRVPETSADQYADLKIRIDLASSRSAEALAKLATPPAGIAPARADLYRGMALQGLGKNAEAEQAFRAAAQADPAILEAQVGIAEVQAARGDVAGALELSRKLVEQHPQLALVWYAHGSILARASKNDEARAALERARDLAGKQLEVPRQGALLSALVELQLTAGDIEAARKNLEAINRLIPGSALAVLMTARVSMATNDYAAAANGLRRLVNASPRFAQARYLLGVALAAQGNLEQASQELTQVVEQAPQNLEARQLLAQVRMRLRDPDGALRVLVPAMESDVDNSRLRWMFESARVQAGADAGTIDTLEQAVRSAPDSRALKLQLASAYLQAGAAAKAAQLLRRLQDGEAPDMRRESLLLQAIDRSEGKAAARARLGSLLAAHRGDPNVSSLAAAFYAAHGEHDRGRALLNDALAGNPKQPDLLFALARLEWSAGRSDGARSALQRLIDHDAHNAQAQVMLVELELAQGNSSAAVARLQAMHQADPKAVEPSLLLARLALARDDAKEADRYVTAALQATANRGDVLQSAGQLYLRSGRFDQAVRLFQDATKSSPSSPAAWLNLGRAQLGLNQRGPARQSIERALTLQPNWLPAVGALAFLEVQEGNGDAALARIEALKRGSANDPGALTLEGEIHSVLQRYAEASRAFEAAAAMRPSPELAAKIFQMRLAGKLPEPVAPIERWMREHPDDLGVRTMLADAYIKVGDPRRASEQYRQILQREPRHVPALNNLAWLYHEMRDERALPTARQAYAVAPRAAAVQDTLGWILVESGRLQEGLPILEQAASAPNAAADIRYHYAAALARAGQRQPASERLTKLLAEQVNFPARDAAQRLLGELEAGE